MHIQRDCLLAKPFPVGHNFEKILSSRQSQASPKYPLDPWQQMEALRKEFVQQKKAELLAKATGGAGEAVEDYAQMVLTV